MTKKRQYPCEKSHSGLCEYGGNKIFNYGFMRGSSSYCRHPRKGQFLCDFKDCPKIHENAKPQNDFDQLEVTISE